MGTGTFHTSQNAHTNCPMTYLRFNARWVPGACIPHRRRARNAVHCSGHGAAFQLVFHVSTHLDRINHDAKRLARPCRARSALQPPAPTRLPAAGCASCRPAWTSWTRTTGRSWTTRGGAPALARSRTQLVVVTVRLLPDRSWRSVMDMPRWWWHSSPARLALRAACTLVCR